MTISSINVHCFYHIIVFTPFTDRTQILMIKPFQFLSINHDNQFSQRSILCNNLKDKIVVMSQFNPLLDTIAFR